MSAFLVPSETQPRPAFHETRVHVSVSVSVNGRPGGHAEARQCLLHGRNICFLQNIHSIRCFTARDPFFLIKQK